MVKVNKLQRNQDQGNKDGATTTRNAKGVNHVQEEIECKDHFISACSCYGVRLIH